MNSSSIFRVLFCYEWNMSRVVANVTILYHLNKLIYTSPKSLDIFEKEFAPKFISSWDILAYNEDTYYQEGL